LLLLGVLAGPIVVLRGINQHMPDTHADFVPVRVGTQIALGRGDPYSRQSTQAIQRFYYGRTLTAADHVIPMDFAYPLYTVLVLAPLAWLPWPIFRIGFIVALAVMSAATVWCWLPVLDLRVSRRRASLMALLFVASWPTVWALRQQQPTLLVAVFMALACLLLTRGRDTLAGVVFALSLIKPQLAGPLLLVLCWWTLRCGRWRFAAAAAVSFGGLMAGSLALDPGWLPRWFRALAEYPRYTHALPVLEIFLGPYLGGPLEYFAIVAVCFVLWRVRGGMADPRRFGQVIAFTLAATDCLNPTFFAMSYNQILLLPACLLVLETPAAGGLRYLLRKATLLLGSLNLLLAPLAAAGLLLSGGNPAWTVLPFEIMLLPVAVTATLGWSMAVELPPTDPESPLAALLDS
jgi:hypothetical protein